MTCTVTSARAWTPRVRRLAVTALSLASVLATACSAPSIERGTSIPPTGNPPAPGVATPEAALERFKDLPARFGLGADADADRIRRWDVDVTPDGRGLPEGSGTVARGTVIYRAQCATCHGKNGEGAEFDKLAGRTPRNGFPFGTSAELSSLRTIGTYWPYATTLFDYVNRAMPTNAPGTLGTEEVYSVVAYLLYLNELLPANATLDRKRLLAISMPARDRFVMDNRRGGPELR
ncbi:MAG: c-type cytochrome [Vicinamibacterales bacterium]